MQKLLVLLLAFVIILSFSGCNNENNTSNHEIVGTWQWDDRPTFFYNFDADGTGFRDFEVDGQQFFVIFLWELTEQDGQEALILSSRRLNEEEKYDLAYERLGTRDVTVGILGTHELLEIEIEGDILTITDITASFDRNVWTRVR